jgi:4a-hydroxytetrahydrobiopterin dehydratase
VSDNRPQPLSDEEIRTRLTELLDWTLREGKLHREFRFDDFVAAFGFMAKLALVAEGMNHHPEWENVYNRVTISLQTHDVSGISNLDFEFAKAADRHFGSGR